MTEIEHEEMSFSFDSPISEDASPASERLYNEIPAAMFDDIRRVFWDCEKSLADIDHWSSQYPQSVIDHLQQLIVCLFLVLHHSDADNTFRIQS